MAKITILILTAAFFCIIFCAEEKPFPIPTLVEELSSTVFPEKAFTPNPPDSVENYPRTVTLSWDSFHDGGDSLLFDVYFSTDTPFVYTDLKSEGQSDSFYVFPEPLLQNQQYLWRIDIRDTYDNYIFGDIWTFTTGTLIDHLPEVSILAPKDSAEFYVLEPVTFRAYAFDKEDGFLSGTKVTWTSDRDGQLGYDTLLVVSDLSSDEQERTEHKITLTAEDTQGGQSSASIIITVIDTLPPNTKPTAAITSPVSDLIFPPGTSITFEGTATDAEDITFPDSSLVWTSSKDNELGRGPSISVSTLTEGEHIITFRVTDSGGKSDDAQIIVTIGSLDNTPPVVTITSPQNNSVFTVDSQIPFRGTVFDAQDGPLGGSQVTWESDIDLQFGTDTVYTSFGDLSVGHHTITLRALDSETVEDTAMIHIFVGQSGNTSPVARFTIQQNFPPADPAEVVALLDASTIYDAQDDISDIEVRWDFESDDTWDTPFTSDKDTPLEYTAGLLPRFVTLQVRDIGGLTDEITLIVPEVAQIPGGSFTMGSLPGKPTEEQPQHTVSLNTYYIDRYEVTNAQFAEFLSENNNAVYYAVNMKIRKLADDSYAAEKDYENVPVVYVDWYAAQAYAVWKGKSLPTEAQWEKAARGITTNDYPWTTQELTPAYANYLTTGRPYDGNAPVATYTGDVVFGIDTENNASSYGVYDLLGNASEWIADYFSASYYSTSPSSNPAGPATGQYKVIRGGSFDTEGSEIRIAKRFWALPEARPYNTGFRCVINP
ncbi:SUMF1/EgtB/PvdO family nonheme iron enzyme [candidate division KSB1 bacterium]